MPDATQHLVELGFTSLEAEVYTYLLSESAVTGYRVAQALGKPAANTYKAIESLQRKGAVMVDDGESRVCRAVPPQELLNSLARRFADTRREAERALARIGVGGGDERLYQLSTRSQVMERCRSMLQRCGHVAVLDAAPPLVDNLRDALEASVRRGAQVVIKGYSPCEVDGARVVIRPRGHEILDAIPGDMISLNIDGAEHLLALLRRDVDAVYQAVWTSSTIVSYLLYNGLVNEVSQVAIMRELEQGTTVESLRATFDELRHLHPASAKGAVYLEFMKRLGVAAPTEHNDTSSPHNEKE